MYTDYDLGEPLDEGAFATIKEKLGKAKDWAKRHKGGIGKGLMAMGALQAMTSNRHPGAAGANLIGGLGTMYIGNRLRKSANREKAKQAYLNMSQGERDYEKLQALKALKQ